MGPAGVPGKLHAVDQRIYPMRMQDACHIDQREGRFKFALGRIGFNACAQQSRLNRARYVGQYRAIALMRLIKRPKGFPERFPRWVVRQIRDVRQYIVTHPGRTDIRGARFPGKAVDYLACFVYNDRRNGKYFPIQTVRFSVKTKQHCVPPCQGRRSK